MLNQEIIEKAIELRTFLHSNPEISGKERITKGILKDFLHVNTSMEIADCGDGFYAAHREEGAEGAVNIALRADYDALALPDGGASHMCGHDGHAAALCAVAMMMEGKKLGKNVFLIFQPGEETGIGAKKCCEIFLKEKIDEIYGLHNLPGFKFGKVLTRKGTFACASRGITIFLKGKPTHAAYPENGISPAPAVGKILSELHAIGNPKHYKGMTMCTVIGVKMGEKAFGAAAEKAEIWMTLRGEHDEDIDLIQKKILDLVHKTAAENKLECGFELQDIFPSTENTDECVDKILKVTGGAELKKPMRWSEDFGHYLHYVKGAFLGIGAGENHPELHTEDYEYPDELLPLSALVLYNLLK